MCREVPSRNVSDRGLAEIPEAIVSSESHAAKMAKEAGETSRVDTRRSWFVCAVCFIAICSASTGFRCSGLLLVSIAQEFGIPIGEASWPCSIVNLQLYFSGIVIGPLAQKYPLKYLLFIGVVMSGLGFALGAVSPNIQLMTLGYGAVHGFGSGTIFVTSNLLIDQNFERYRGMAYGIAHSASAVASIIFPSIFNFASKQWGFRYAMLTIGVILLSFAPLPLLVENAPRTKTDSSTGGSKTKVFYWSVFRTPMFYIIASVNLVFQYGYDTFWATIVDYGSQRGLDIESILILIGCYSVADIIGRIGLPILSDHGWLARDTLLAISYFASTAMLIFLCFCKSLMSFILLVLLFGIFFGLSNSYIFSVVSQYLGKERLPFAFGMLGTIGGLVFVSMPSAIGLFRDKLKDYRYMYILNGSLLFLTTFPWLIVIYRRKTGRST